MKRKSFNNVDELCQSVTDMHDLLSDLLDDGYMGTAVVGYYEVIFDVLNHLVKNYDFTINNADFTEPDYHDYVDEYVLIISDDTINIEKMKYDGHDRYVNLCDFITFIHGDCNSAIFKSSPDTAFVEFDFSD